MTGWIRINRDIVNHWIYQNEKWRLWWIDMLLMAAWEETEVADGKQMIRLEKGQILASVSDLCKRWKANTKEVRYFLDKLIAEDMIVAKARAKQRAILTISNYVNYQAPGAKQRAKAVANENKQENKEQEGYSKRYLDFLKYLETHTPYCYKNMTLPTEVEFYKMVDKYGAKMVAETVEQIENRKDLRKTYTNLYRTMLNWLENEMKRRGNNGAV